jgi:hypothetical protein
MFQLLYPRVWPLALRARSVALLAAAVACVACVWAVPSALAAGAAATGPATSVTPTQATLHGTISPGGLSGQYYFQYSVDTSYSMHTQLVQFPASSQPIQVSAIASPLTPGTTYHYRLAVLLYAKPQPIPSYGADATLTTPSSSGPPGAVGVPGVATTGSATSITRTSAILNGTVDPQNIDSVWSFAWGPTSTYAHYTPVQPIQGDGPMHVSVPISGLAPGTLYHFRLVVLQGSYPSQTASAGIDVTFVTATSNSTGGSSSGGSRSTPQYGVAVLGNRTLAVHGGVVSMAWVCRGTRGARCRGRIDITARGRVRGRPRTVSCGSGKIVASVGHRHIVRGRVSGDCETLLKKARRHRVVATLVSTFSTYQTPLKTRVTLTGT